MGNKMTKQDIFRYYDTFVSLTMYHIRTLSEGKDICFKKFDCMNPEHRYLLRIALYNKDFQNCELKIAASRKDIRKINKLLGKNFSKIKKCKDEECNIDVPALLFLLRECGKNMVAEDFRLSDILNEYYDDFMKGKNKNV